MLPKKSSKPIIINECRTRAPAVKHNVKEGSGVLLRSHRRRHSEKYREEKVIDVLSTSAREQDNTDLEASQKPQSDGADKEMRSEFGSNYQDCLIPTKLAYPSTDPPVSEDESDFTRLQTDFEKHLSFPHGSSDSELENISECGATSGSQRSIREEATCPTAFPADRSKLLKVFLTREEQRLSLLSNLLSEFASMKNVRSTSVTNEVRNILQNLYYIQKAFVKELYVNQHIMDDPNAEICLVFHCVVQRQALLSSYQKTVAAMMNKSGPAKPLNSSESDKDPNGAILALRNSLQEPYTWIVQTVEDMKSLSQATSTRNPDHQGFEALYETLMKETIECHSVVPAYGKELSFGTVRKLLLHSLVVELLNWNTDERKLRYLLLFTDVLVCAKVVRKDRHRTGLGGMFRGVRESTRHRNQTRGQMMQPEQPTGKCSSQEQTVRLETKWIIPIESLTLHSNMRVGTDQQREAEQEKKIERLKELISGLRESKEKLKGEEDKVRLQRTKAALSKLEGQLVIQTPQLIIPISEFQNQRHLILLVTERERNHWRTALEKAIQSAGGTRSGPPTKNTVLLKAATISSSDGAFETRSRMGIEQTCPRINSSDMDKILCKYQHLIRFNKTGLALLMGQNSSGRTGILRTEVHGITGLNDIDSYHVVIEVDSYSQFEEVARTSVITNQANPQWNQVFDVAIDDAHKICFTVYRHSDVFAEIEVKLTEECVCNKRLEMTVKTREPVSRCIVFAFTLSLHEKLKSDTKTLNKPQKRIFGSSLSSILQSDARAIRMAGNANENIQCGGRLVPLIVAACTDEIERRGLRETGIYRICGSNHDITELKELFDRDLLEGKRRLPNVDITAVASLLKQFFRDLPECLIPASVSGRLMQAVELSEEHQRLHAIADGLNKLPKANLETFQHLATHLVTVDRYSDTNKMDLGNLALLWATTLFENPLQDLQQLDKGEDHAPCADVLNSVNKEASMAMYQTRILFAILSAIREETLCYIESEGTFTPKTPPQRS